MFSDFSANSILAKSLAKYGRRLKSADYQSLLSCSKVTEVASYLKNNTAYKDVLEDINENDIHRGYLELVLNRRIFKDMAHISSYSVSIGKYFSDYLVMKVTVKHLIHKLIFLYAGESEETPPLFPKFARRRAKIDWYALNQAKNFEDFLRALQSSDYYEVLLPFKPTVGKGLNLPEIENALYTYLYSETLSSVDRLADKNTKKKLTDILLDMINIQNYTSLMRLKRSYKVPPSQISRLLIPLGFFKTQKAQELINAESCEEVYNGMLNTSVGKRVLRKNTSGDILALAKFQSARYNIRFSSSPIVVAFSYLIMMEIELGNIVHIVEGVRYGLDKDSIEKLLIISKN